MKFICFSAFVAITVGFIYPESVIAATSTEARLETAKSILESSGFERRHKVQMELPSIGIPAFDQLVGLMKMNPEFQSMINRSNEALPRVRDRVAELYADKFTDADLAAIMKFFRSPVGQKYAALLPELQQAEGKMVVEEIFKSDPKIAAALDAEKRRQTQLEAERASLEQQVNAGSAQAMYRLGATYCSGGNPTDRKDNLLKCFNWKLRAAEAGLAEAQHDIGFSYIDGRYGNEKSGAEMFKWLKRAAENGHSASMYYVGSAYAGNNKVFGNMPTGVEPSAKDAEFWLQKSANTGGMGATMDLASMYFEGRVVERDMQKAIYWYSQAAEKRNTFAMRKLGEIYEEGQGAQANLQEAMKWYKQAAGIQPRKQ